MKKYIHYTNGKQRVLTKKLADELCFELWDWLYRHPSKKKHDWERWDYNNGDIESFGITSHCFYCFLYVVPFCRNCPLNDKSSDSCGPNDSFVKWTRARSPKTRKKYAKIIRDVAGKRLGKET